MIEGETIGRSNVAARAFAIGALVLAAATLVARLAMGTAIRRVHELPNDPDAYAERLTKFVEFLPEIARTEGPAAIVVGSSPSYFGIALDTFDGRLRELGAPMTTYTAATPLVTSSVELALARRIARTFTRAHRKLDLALVEFTPQLMTESSLHLGPTFQQANLRDLVAVGGPGDFGKLVLEEPDRGFHAAALAALGNHDPTTFATLLAARIFVSPALRARRARTPHALLEAAIEAKYGEDSAFWNREARGEPRWLFPASQRIYADLMRVSENWKDQHHAEVERRLVVANDALELHMSEQRLTEFVTLVKELEAVSIHTVIWLAPRNVDFMRPTSAGLERLAAALARVAVDTRAPIIDLTAMPGIEPQDFLDAEHASEHRGRPKISVALADGVARAIRQNEVETR